MAEMTVAEAIHILNKKVNERAFYHVHSFDAQLIAVLLEQQATEIERLKAGPIELCKYSLEQESEILRLHEVIAKKDRMIDMAVQQLFDDGICPDGGYECNDGPVGHSGCIKCWLSWLEKEAEGVEYDGR